MCIRIYVSYSRRVENTCATAASLYRNVRWQTGDKRRWRRRLLVSKNAGYIHGVYKVFHLGICFNGVPDIKWKNIRAESGDFESELKV